MILIKLRSLQLEIGNLDDEFKILVKKLKSSISMNLTRQKYKYFIKVLKFISFPFASDYLEQIESFDSLEKVKDPNGLINKIRINLEKIKKVLSNKKNPFEKKILI